MFSAAFTPSWFFLSLPEPPPEVVVAGVLALALALAGWRALKRSHSLRRQAEDRLRRLLTSVSGFLVTLKGRGQIEVESVGVGCDPVTGFQPRDYLEDGQLWRRNLEDPNRALGADGEFRIRHRDGSFRWVRQTALGDAGALTRHEVLVEDITPRKVAEGAQQQLVDRLNKISQRVPGVVYQYRLRPDGTSCFPYASETIRTIYQVSPEEVKEDASAVFSRLHPDDFAGVSQAIAASARDLTRWEQEFRVKFPDGTVRHLLGNAAPDREADGSTLWYGYISDITDRKRTEAATRTQSAQLRALFDTIPDLVWLKDPEGVYLACNRHFEKLNGGTEEDIVGHTDYDFVDQKDADFFRERDQEAARKGQACVNEEWLTFADGHREETETIKTPVYHPDGSLLGVLGIGRDITARKLAERQIRNASLHFRNLLETSLDPLVTIHASGQITDVNVATERVTGVDRATLVGKDFADFFTDPELARAGYQKAFAQGRVTDYPLAIRHVSGRVTEVLYNAAVYRDEVGVVQGVFAAARDVSAMHRVESEKAELQVKLLQAQKMESLGILASGLAHEMNNVLASILTLASTKLLILKPGDPNRRTFENISRAAERGGKTVKKLLSFARQTTVEETELDWNSLVRDFALVLGPTLPGPIRLDLDLASSLKRVSGDPSALTQALAGLCSNAVDALPLGGTLTLRTRNRGDQVAVDVEDTGIGMTAEVREKAIDPFFTTKPEGHGTGLGLSLAFRTMEAHRATLSIESTVGRGTVVTMLFPASHKAPLEPVQPPTSEVRPLVVLVVDDDAFLLESVQELLEALGHRATITAGGQEALAALQGGLSPDVVLLDLNMPGWSGAETLSHLRPLYPDLPVVLSTGRTDQIALDLITAYPLVTLLPKPYTVDELRTELQKVTPRR